MNAVFLVALCFSITVESIKRFIDLEEIHRPEIVLLVGFLGLLINLVGLILLKDGGHGHSHAGHNKLAQMSSIDENEDYIFVDAQTKKPPSPKKSSGHYLILRKHFA